MAAFLSYLSAGATPDKRREPSMRGTRGFTDGFSEPQRSHPYGFLTGENPSLKINTSVPRRFGTDQLGANCGSCGHVLCPKAINQLLFPFTSRRPFSLERRLPPFKEKWPSRPGAETMGSIETPFGGPPKLPRRPVAQRPRYLQKKVPPKL